MPGSSPDTPLVIVGGGMAGGNAAVALREEGFEGRVVMIAPRARGAVRSAAAVEDLHALRGGASRAGTSSPLDWYSEHEVERRSDPASSRSIRAARAVALDSGEQLAYEKLLIATGGRNRRLDVPGSDLEGIHQLRTVAECDAIKREAVSGRHAVVVGMGFIGCEVAASLTQLGVRVTAVVGGHCRSSACSASKSQRRSLRSTASTASSWSATIASLRSREASA